MIRTALLLAAMVLGADGSWGEEAPGLCGSPPPRKPVPEAKCKPGERPKWVCRKWYNGDFWSGCSWRAECR